MSRTSALGTKLTALAMSTLLATSTPLTATIAYAEENSDDADATVEQDAAQAPKDEIVYTRTDATGAASGTYVVNYFNTPQAVEVADPGTYDKVTNLSTTEQLEDANGTVNLTTLAGQPFYYQGDLADGTQLPWKVDITYTLDGKEVSPEDLSGADGDLDIELKIAGLDDDSATADFAKSFVLQAQGTFADANFNLTDAGDATISTVGDKTLVTYLQLPGTDGDYHIKGKATDFTYSGWQIAAMPLSLDLNVADYDTSQLTDAAGELESATTQLADGGSSLRSGLSQLNTGASTAATGATTLSNGANTLQAQLQAQQGNFNTLNSGAAQVAGGVHELSTTLQTTLPATLSQANTQVSSLRTQTNTIRGEVDGIKQGAAGVSAAGQTITDQATAVGTDLQNMSSSLQTLSALQHTLTTVGTNDYDAAVAAGTAKGYADGAVTAIDGVTTATSSAETTLNDLLDSGTLDENETAQVQAALTAIQTAETTAGRAKEAAKTASDNANTAQIKAEDSATKLNNIKTSGSTITTLAGNQNQEGQLVSDAKTLQQSLEALGTNATTLMATSDKALNQADSALDQADALISSTQGTMSGMGTQLGRLNELDAGAQQVSSGVSALTANLTQTTANGQTTIYGASTQIASGANQLSSGLNTLSAGTQTAYTGSGTLSDGLNELRDAVSGMDQKVLDEVQETIDEKLGTGYRLHSFVDADNTDVNEVQFVYVVDGVEDPSDSDDATTETAADTEDDSNQTFTQRLVALFKHDDE